MFGKHLKIVEQIAIVFIFAVVVPMTISGFIINNINQQSVRSQLRQTAVLIANMVSDEIDFFISQNQMTLSQVAYTLNYLDTPQKKQDFLDSIEKKVTGCDDIIIVKYQSELDEITKHSRENKKAVLYTKLKNGDYLTITYNVEDLRAKLFKSLDEDTRQIYVLDENEKLIAEHNFTDDVFQKTMKLLPKYRKFDDPVIFGDVKNQPIVYVTKEDPKITIIVNTTEDITNSTINDNRLKIILSVLAATITILFVSALYTYYLYINIRQGEL